MLTSLTNNQLSNAINAAVTFLLNAKNPEGWWLDYDTVAGPSDEWVTAYVSTMLSIVPEDHVFKTVRQAWELLKTRSHRPTGGWGYNFVVSGDADTTGWALQLARAVNQSSSEQVQQAKAFLATHQRSDGGMATFASEEVIRPYFANVYSKNPLKQTFEGWCASHVCVSAAIATLPEYYTNLHDYLKATQTPQGNWQCYWWFDHEYATALAAEALASGGQATDQSCIDRAIAWAVQRLSPQGFVATFNHPHGSTFATALCLRLLLLDTVNPEVITARVTATQWLLEQQQTSGGWISSAWLRKPYTNDINPEQFTQWEYHGKGEGSVILDQNSIFTTATVVHSLQKVSEVLNS
ncbi:MAG: hypothetical protein NHB32_00120 [Fischerella sp. CENA71]|nr:hypothetical protein [Fischerella sp. CENA71]